MRIVVDAFGGDNAPDAVLTGCANALAAFDDLSLMISGDMNTITQKLGGLNVDLTRVEILDAPEIITNHEHPVQAVKQKKDSSLVRALTVKG